MKRRELLKLFALAPMLWHAPALASKRWARTLVLVELKGGNDGLNTLVPFTDPLYYRMRPHLGLNPKSVLPIDKNWGLNGAMEALQPAWYAYEMAVIHGVGYANPHRSHFRSIAVWDTASDSDDYLRDGWLARQFAAAWPRTGYVADAIQMGPGDAGPLASRDMRVLVLDDPATVLRKGKRSVATIPGGGNPALTHVLKEREKLGDGPEVLNLPMIEVPESFPRTRFAQRLGEIVRHMESDNAAPVYKVTLPGFDTHHNQRTQHDRLLRELAEGLAAFRNTLSDSGLWTRTLVLTYSEFGRHASENATGGTDHGTCAPQFMLGGNVQGGLYGQPPSLADLDQGDLRFTTDFRRLYATVVEGWWGMRQVFLPGRRFEPIPCLRG